MTIEEFNKADEDAARAALLPCCTSKTWVQQMVQQRSFVDVEALLRSAEETWWAMQPDDWFEAFEAHPKIGETKLSEWCSQEQSGVLTESANVLRRLAEGNRQYEERFGWLFLVNASGKNGSHILELLEARLANSTKAELRIAAREQAQITTLRLRRLFPG